MKTIKSTIPLPIHPSGILSVKKGIPLHRTAFFDIETTGLAPEASSIYLVGLMIYDAPQDCYQLTQWFADNYHSEKNILIQLLQTLTNVDRLCHFNGKTFDIPYVLKKCKRHKIEIPAHCQKLFEGADGLESLDLLQEIRPLKKLLGLTQCKQISIEHWLGIQREDFYNGKDLALVYSEYMQKKLLSPPDSEKLLSALLLHNHDDIAMLPELCSILNYKDYLAGAGDNPLLTEENLSGMAIHYEEGGQLLTLTLPLPSPLPREITLTGHYTPTCKGSTDTPAVPILQTSPNPPRTLATVQAGCHLPGIWQLTLAKENAYCQIPVLHGCLKYFLPNHTEYYYLPDEDTAIHKSIASFVDSSHRKKATAATCFSRREGRFLPLPYCRRKKKTAPFHLPTFYTDYKTFPAFCELPEDFQSNRAFWREYLAAQMAGAT